MLFLRSSSYMRNLRIEIQKKNFGEGKISDNFVEIFSDTIIYFLTLKRLGVTKFQNYLN